ncbi:MAG: HlyD family efflux transporter periplasmic adaptor subunit [Hydrogenibacillus schlegelii]|uniref:HlyD family efflux transporter periplasmic adaptor subunit n=1 Tax=Hydrogenibacillus schlegelii TaxID=1484 RepID=A0A947CU42_HYDSH|nr:HlyD family efflux transporter periplasmic adaptor subunit [Hydrogenibacillus schlegelii]
MNRRTAFLLTFLGTALSTLALGGCALFPAEPAEERLPDIRPPKIAEKPEHVVARGRLVLTARGQGEVFSEREATLSFTAGDDTENARPLKLKTLTVRPGDAVRKGALLAELDTRNLDLEIEKMRDQLKVEEHKLILEIRKVPQNEAERLAQEQAKASFREQARALTALERRQSGARITAPFAGEIVRVMKRVGDEVKPYEPVLTLVDPTARLVGVRVADKDRPYLRLGMTASVEVAGVEKPLPGNVVHLPADAGDRAAPGGGPPDEREGLVWIRVDDLPDEAAPGTFARATFELLAKEDVVKIPRSFLYQYGGRTYVIVKDGDKRREVDVEVGLETPTEVEIVRGLTGGERIVGR